MRQNKEDCKDLDCRPGFGVPGSPNHMPLCANKWHPNLKSKSKSPFTSVFRKVTWQALGRLLFLLWHVAVLFFAYGCSFTFTFDGQMADARMAEWQSQGFELYRPLTVLLYIGDDKFARSPATQAVEKSIRP